MDERKMIMAYILSLVLPTPWDIDVVPSPRIPKISDSML